MKNDLLYRELGVNPDASQDEIQAAFRKRAKETHPDHGGTAAKFWHVETAYRVLSDPERRKRYDETGDPNPPEPDNSEAQALNLIANMIVGVLSLADSPHDVLAVMRRDLQNNKTQLQHQINAAGARIRAAENLGKRFKTKRASDPIAAAFAQQIEMANVQIEGSKQTIAVMDRATAILTEYEFEPERMSAALVGAMGMQNTAAWERDTQAAYNQWASGLGCP